MRPASPTTVTRLGALLSILCLAVLHGCRHEPPLNLLFVTFDTTRADHMGYASGRAGITPVLDAIASGGTWFSTCVSSQPLTLPAHTSLFSGLYPFHHGVRDNSTYVVGPEVETLAERLQAAGYETHAIVSSFVLDSRFGLDQGFDGYDDDLSAGREKAMFMFREVPAEVSAAKAVRWIRAREHREKPFFLWLHFFDPHANYSPPEADRALFPGDPYSAEIHHADAELGKVIESLRQSGDLERTLFVFAADHGESLGEHGERTHGLFVYDSTTRVPLLFAGPGVPMARRVDGVVRSVDVLPTVLELLHLRKARGLDGRSLRPLWRQGSRSGEPRVAYSESLAPRLGFGWSELRALRSDQARVIAAPRREAYMHDLHDADPAEQRNVASSAGGAVPELFGELEKIAEADPFSHGEQRGGEVDASARTQLEALGYIVGSPAAGPQEGVALADPKDRLGDWEALQAAREHLRHDRFQQAAALLEPLVASGDANVNAMSTLAMAYVGLEQTERALQLYARVRELDPSLDAGYLAPARLLRLERKFEEAEQLARAELARRPLDIGAHVTLGEIYLDQERYADAEASFRRALELEPNATNAASGLGNCLNRAGRLEEAREVLSRAHEHDPDHLAVTYNLAVVTDRLGDSKTALQLYQQALRTDPKHAMSWNNLGSLLDRLGRHDLARKAIEQALQLDPRNTEAAYNLAALHAQAGDLAGALPLCEQALRNDPRFVRAAQLRASVLERLGHEAEALAAWRQLADAVPAAWLRVARLELAGGRREEARRAVAAALERGGEKIRTQALADPKLVDLVQRH